MKHEIKVNSLLRIMKIADAFRHWLCHDGDTLVASAYLLGGSTWALRVSAVVDCARQGGDLHTLPRVVRSTTGFGSLQGVPMGLSLGRALALDRPIPQ